MKVNFVQEVCTFARIRLKKRLSHSAQDLWLALFILENDEAHGDEWPDEPIELSEREILLNVSVNKSTFYSARNELVTKGLLRYEAGKRNTQPARYQLVLSHFIVQNSYQPPYQPPYQGAYQPPYQPPYQGAYQPPYQPTDQKNESLHISARAETKTKTETETETLTESEGSAQKRASRPAKKFSPPSTAEVNAYAAELGKTIDADQFVAYYAARKWKLSGGLPIDESNWKSTVDSWILREGKFSSGAQGAKQPKMVREQMYSQRPIEEGLALKRQIDEMHSEMPDWMLNMLHEEEAAQA